MSTIRVLLANEMRLMANVIAASLEDEQDIKFVGTATTAQQALTLASTCDVVLISTRLPDGSALELTKEITQIFPKVKVLVLGLAESEAEILQYVEAGAIGYVLKDDSVDELIKNIRAAHSDEALVSPQIAAALMTRVSELAQLFADTVAIPDSVVLTPREHDVLHLVAKDYTNQEIADQLVIKVGNKRVAVLVEDGFDQEPLTRSLEILRSRGAQPDIISPANRRVKGWHLEQWGAEFPVSAPLASVEAKDIDGLLLPAGKKSVETLRGDVHATEFVKAFDDMGKPIVALCHAIGLLVKAGIVNGRRVTSYEGLQRELEKAGAACVSQRVVIDGNLATSRSPGAIPELSQNMIKVYAEA